MSSITRTPPRYPTSKPAPKQGGGCCFGSQNSPSSTHSLLAAQKAEEKTLEKTRYVVQKFIQIYGVYEISSDTNSTTPSSMSASNSPGVSPYKGAGDYSAPLFNGVFVINQIGTNLATDKMKLDFDKLVHVGVATDDQFTSFVTDKGRFISVLRKNCESKGINLIECD